MYTSRTLRNRVGYCPVLEYAMAVSPLARTSSPYLAYRRLEHRSRGVMVSYLQAKFTIFTFHECLCLLLRGPLCWREPYLILRMIPHKLDVSGFTHLWRSNKPFRSSFTLFCLSSFLPSLLIQCNDFHLTDKLANIATICLLSHLPQRRTPTCLMIP